MNSCVWIFWNAIKVEVEFEVEVEDNNICPALHTVWDEESECQHI
jgi:hypothetical protein